jgi:hypothetical protein
LVGLCILWARSRDIGENQIGLAIVLAVFVAPHLHYHDLTLLLVALVAALMVLVRSGFLSTQKAALVPLALSLALLFSNFTPILMLNFPYLIMLLLVLALYLPSFILLIYCRSYCWHRYGSLRKLSSGRAQTNKR